ncbi:PREDICTED: Transposon Ty3-I Gag-Pol poly [Prunus dulcis]|uniref:PREDICTED: Transposon Ty3-I Gag-Pol poly n=1 Tax=Prunus dulcis TaxID=3755 RepID=A0A5E4G1A8_PRUDU|nr:PREDICTED: Transposon Ty3-I Gag-Pol poly [Prunus dulcis]
MEAINKIVKKMLKKKLGAAKGDWPEMLPEALSVINTLYRRSTRETLFFLAFGTKGVLLVEINAATYRMESYDPVENKAQRALNLDVIEKCYLQTTYPPILQLVRQTPIIQNRD